MTTNKVVVGQKDLHRQVENKDIEFKLNMLQYLFPLSVAALLLFLTVSDNVEEFI